jgi:hypothetical protein
MTLPVLELVKAAAVIVVGNKGSSFSGNLRSTHPLRNTFGIDDNISFGIPFSEIDSDHLQHLSTIQSLVHATEPARTSNHKIPDLISMSGMSSVGGLENKMIRGIKHISKASAREVDSFTKGLLAAEAVANVQEGKGRGKNNQNKSDLSKRNNPILRAVCWFLLLLSGLHY